MLKHQFLNSDRFKIYNTTHGWFYTDTLEQYNKVKDNPQVQYNPGEVVYKFNNRGFRCDDFSNWKNHPIRILFAGCSETEGVGIPLEKTWAKLFHNMLCDQLGPIPFWSIAHSGASMDHLVKHLYLEGNELRPQIVISLLPRFERRERWSEDHWGPWLTYTKEDKNTAKIFLKEEYIRYQTEKNLSFIDLLMNRWDSLFLYSKIDSDYDLSNITFSKFKNVDHRLEFIDLGRDGWHAGPESNKLFAERMFNDFYPYIREKLNDS